MHTLTVGGHTNTYQTSVQSQDTEWAVVYVGRVMERETVSTNTEYQVDNVRCS